MLPLTRTVKVFALQFGTPRLLKPPNCSTCSISQLQILPAAPQTYQANPLISQIACCDHGYGHPPGRPQVLDFGLRISDL